MNSDVDLDVLIRRFWEAEAAVLSSDRNQRLRWHSPKGDLFNIDEEVARETGAPGSADRFIKCAIDSKLRPDEDRTVAWIAITIDNMVKRGDIDILERLRHSSIDPELLKRIRIFLDE